MKIMRATVRMLRGRFPMDMLRYDRCSPQGPVDLFRMEEKMDDLTMDQLNEHVEIHVLRCGDTLTEAKNFTVGRWNSFGVGVLSIEPWS